MRNRPTPALTCAAIAVAVALAGCGGSSTAPGVQLAPSAGATSDTTTVVSATTPSASTTATTTASVATPATGPLSTEPKISVPKGTAPKALQVKDLVKGTGAAAKAGSIITVNYVGALYTTGKVFDASWNRKQTFSTPLATTSVIAGWVQGIAGMHVGGRRELIIPPSLAYRSAAQPGIPANSTLIFVVDLLKVA